MFVRNGEKLGSIQVDPSHADPQKRPKASAVKAETKQEPPASDSVVDNPDAVSTLEPEPTPAPEPAKTAAPAKSAFKSALNKPKG